MKVNTRKERKRSKKIPGAGNQEKNLGCPFLKKILIGLTKKSQKRWQLSSEEYFEFGKKLRDWVIVGCGAALIIGLTYLVILIAKSFEQ